MKNIRVTEEQKAFALRQAEFVYYRLLDGLQEFARLYRLRLAKMPLEPLQTGNCVTHGLDPPAILVRLVGTELV